MKYQWIIFDADDTLFDYSKAEEHALESAFTAFGVELEAGHVELYQKINHRIWRRFESGQITQSELKVRRFEQLFDEAGLEGDPARFSSRYLEGLAQGTYLIDGAEQIVRDLHGRIGMVILTNGLKDVQRPRLAGSALNGYFADVVISEEVGSAKPEPEIFDIAFSKMGNPDKHDVLIVGDSLTSDIQGGSDYGIDTCWFNPKRRPRVNGITITYEINEISKIVAIAGG